MYNIFENLIFKNLDFITSNDNISITHENDGHIIQLSDETAAFLCARSAREVLGDIVSQALCATVRGVARQGVAPCVPTAH